MDGNAPAMMFNDTFAYGKTKSCPIWFSGALACDLVKFFEDPLMFLRGDPGAVISHLDADIPAFIKEADLYSCMLTGIFHGVGDEVDDHLHDAVSVSCYDHRG